MKSARIAIFALGVAVAPGVESFELATHAAITLQAHNRFMNESPKKLDELGIFTFMPDARTASIFGRDYFDVLGSQVATRHAHPFENNIIAALAGEPLGVVGWLMRGAIREDDSPLWPFVDNPQDDPYLPAVSRFLNHFFDPVGDRPLTIIASLGQTAPNWAIGSLDAYRAPNSPDLQRRNHFTVFDVRESMFRALTLKTLRGGCLLYTSPSPRDGL